MGRMLWSVKLRWRIGPCTSNQRSVFATLQQCRRLLQDMKKGREGRDESTSLLRKKNQSCGRCQVNESSCRPWLSSEFFLRRAPERCPPSRVPPTADLPSPCYHVSHQSSHLTSARPHSPIRQRGSQQALLAQTQTTNQTWLPPPRIRPRDAPYSGYHKSCATRCTVMFSPTSESRLNESKWLCLPNCAPRTSFWSATRSTARP